MVGMVVVIVVVEIEVVKKVVDVVESRKLLGADKVRRACYIRQPRGWGPNVICSDVTQQQWDVSTSAPNV